MGKVALKTALEAICVQKSVCSRKALKTNEKSMRMNPRAVPKRPKILPRWPQDGLEEVFSSHLFLASILVRFGIRFRLYLGAQIGHFGDRFLDDFCMSFQDRPKSAQERPKSRQEPPKSFPRAPKSGPRAAKSLPRASQERPRAAQERPREPQERQKASQELSLIHI